MSIFQNSQTLGLVKNKISQGKIASKQSKLGKTG